MYVQLAASAAPGLSAGLFQLMRPPHLRDENDVSAYYCEWIEHPSGNGWAVLALPETEQVPIHVEADATLLMSILDEFLTNGAITQEELDAIINGVTASAGQMVRVLDFIPQSWIDAGHMLDREQAEAMGYFSAEEEV